MRLAVSFVAAIPLAKAETSSSHKRISRNLYSIDKLWSHRAFVHLFRLVRVLACVFRPDG